MVCNDNIKELCYYGGSKTSLETALNAFEEYCKQSNTKNIPLDTIKILLQHSINHVEKLINQIPYGNELLKYLKKDDSMFKTEEV